MPRFNPLFLITTAAGMGLVSACATGSTAPPGAANQTAADLTGSYVYRASDEVGQPLLAGNLSLAAVDDTTAAGTWLLHWAAGADSTRTVGPQVGSGTLAAEYTAGRWHLTFTPGWADNNVDLIGVLRGDSMTGAWTHTTLTGPAAHGRFAAVRP